MSLNLDHYFEKHSDLLTQFSGLKVKLQAWHKEPYNLSIAAARTCYSSRGIISTSDVSANEETRALRDKIAASTLEAGHLTTRQHPHFVFSIEGISRHLIWQVLHSHPYYNSEQVSQRYVPIKKNQWYCLPASLDIAKVHTFHDRLFNDYENLIQILFNPVSEIYFSIFRARKSNPAKYKNDIRKKCMELARYVLPLGTTAYLYHTINANTLYRYARTMYNSGIKENIVLVLKMLREIEKVDPELIKEIPLPSESIPDELSPRIAREKIVKFDNKLKNSGYDSLLFQSSISSRENLEEIIELLQGIPDGQIDWAALANTEKEPYLIDSLAPLSMHAPSRWMNQVHFTFMKKLSHTADSQEQRHRTLPGTRPLLASQITLEADYITPSLIREIPQAEKVYNQTMEDCFTTISDLYKTNQNLHDLTYLLPNAFPIRYFESGDFMNFLHKWKSRLCYNAQEEIFYSSLDETRQVINQYPFLEKFIGPPCALRTHAKPRCPEGNRYCGVKVWELKFSEYNRKI